MRRCMWEAQDARDTKLDVEEHQIAGALDIDLIARTAGVRDSTRAVRRTTVPTSGLQGPVSSGGRIPVTSARGDLLCRPRRCGATLRSATTTDGGQAAGGRQGRVRQSPRSGRRAGGAGGGDGGGRGQRRGGHAENAEGARLTWYT